MPAKLPQSFIQKPVRHLRDVAVGETVFLMYANMQPDAHGCCYLKPDAELWPQEGPNRIQVTRANDGFHVTILEDYTWQLGKYEEHALLSKDDDWFPVESITPKTAQETTDEELRSRGLQSSS
jgi:hypothetical protein